VNHLSAYSDCTGSWGLLEADALKVLPLLPERSVDAVITDPPYGIAFHGEAWDGADLRRTGLGASEAFERWTTRWASECLRLLKPGGHLLAFGAPRTFHRLVAGVEDAGLEIRDQVLWVHGQGIPKSRRLPGGLGTSLKPAYEPILIARAPLTGRTEDNVRAFSTGALNIDAAREPAPNRPEGYWPANLALSHGPDCPVAELDDPARGPSRLFYTAKASRAEREAGCEQIPRTPVQIYIGKHHPPRLVHNVHPTVKPLALMRWLVRLAVPDGGFVLDAFAGSGTTGIAATLEGKRFLGIEQRSDYLDVACARLAHWAALERT
jgi:DNA modification methylase